MAERQQLRQPEAENLLGGKNKKKLGLFWVYKNQDKTKTHNNGLDFLLATKTHSSCAVHVMARVELV